MKTVIVGAGSDLGVHFAGALLGPVLFLNDLKGFYKGETMEFMQDESIIKSRNLSDRRKNEYEIEQFNTQLYKALLEKKIPNKKLALWIGGGAATLAALGYLIAPKNKDSIG